MSKSASLRGDRPLVDRVFDQSERKSWGRRRRHGSSTLLLLEGLEDRTLLAASINIDAASLLTYETDPAVAETLRISVVGSIYTFESDRNIEVESNTPGLIITGDGTGTVTVEGITGLAVDATFDRNNITLESTTVATTITISSDDNDFTLGSDADVDGLGAITGAVEVRSFATTASNTIVADDSGAAPASVSYDLTSVTLARAGFGGLTYSGSGIRNLIIRGASTAAGGESRYDIESTNGDISTQIDDSASQGSGVYTVMNTSGSSVAFAGLEIIGATGPSNFFDLRIITGRVEIDAGLAATNALRLSNNGVLALAGVITLVNDTAAPFDVEVDGAASMSGGGWLLSTVDDEGSPRSELLLGLSGRLRFLPDQLNNLTLLNNSSTGAGFSVDFDGGSPLPRGVVTYDANWNPIVDLPSSLGLDGDPGTPLQSVTHAPTSSGAGQITVVEADSTTRTIVYSGLSPHSIFDTVSALSATFVYSGNPSIPVRIEDGLFIIPPGQSLGIFSDPTTPQFPDTYIARKNVINVDLSSNPGDHTVTVDYSSGVGPVADLGRLNIITGGGDDVATLLSLPPDVATSLAQGGGTDRATISLAGALQAAAVLLDGGAGIDGLTIDADGLVTAADFFAGPGGSTIIAVPGIPGGITYSNYESVTLLDAAPVVPVVTAIPIHAVAGQALVNVNVGVFVGAPGTKATDYAATINWADGTSTAATIVQDGVNPTLFYAYGTHTYYDFTSFPSMVTTLTVTSLGTTTTQFINGVPVTIVTPAGDPVASQSFVYVTQAPMTLTVNAFSGFENIPIATAGSIIVASFVDAGGIDPTDPSPAARYVAMINWGDGTSSISPLEILRNGNTNTFYVLAAPHTYSTPGSFVVTVMVSDNNFGGLSSVVATNVAMIADAPLTATPSQPTNTPAQEGVQFVDWVVGSFVDANPLATTDQYQVTIDWNDGSPVSAGRVIQPGGVGTTFYVVGTHTYANSRAAGAFPYTVGAGPVAGPVTLTGTYQLTMSIRDTFGSSLNLFNPLTVADRPLGVAGALDSASDSGISNSDAVTNDTTPTFSGYTSEGNASIYLYASYNGGPTTLLGSTTSDAAGAWSLTVASAMADGGYRIQAQAYDSFGHTISALTTITSALVIDTKGPKVADVLFDNFRGQVIATFNDFGGVADVGTGLALASLRDANNFRFSKLTQLNPRLRWWKANAITVTPGTTTGAQVATIVFNNGAGIRGGRYLFDALSADPANLSGIRDVAGNALDGEFYGFFPSGNNVDGGDFSAQLDAIHHTIFPPRTRVGAATPVSPAGTPGTGRFLTRDGNLLPSAASAVRLSSARAGRTAPLGS